MNAIDGGRACMFMRASVFTAVGILFIIDFTDPDTTCAYVRNVSARVSFKTRLLIEALLINNLRNIGVNIFYLSEITVHIYFN